MDENQWFRTALSCAIMGNKVTFRPAALGAGMVCEIGGIAGEPSSGVVAAFASALLKTPGGEFLLSTRPKGTP